MAQEPRASGTIKSAKTVFDIVEIMQRQGPIGVTELADAIDMAPSTVHAYLSTMVEHEYVVKRDGKYELGCKFVGLGREVQFDMDLVQAATPTLQELAEDTGEEGWIIVEEHGHSVPIMRESGGGGIESVGRIGKHTYAHDNGGGKCILANLPRRRVQEIIETHGLPERTSNTITDPDELFDELETARERGYAVSDEERYEGIRSVFSPIIVGEQVYGAVGVAGPSNRLSGELYREQLPNQIMEAANEIELRLRYPKFNGQRR